MIIQGTNVPVILNFPVSLSGAKEVEVSLTTVGGKELKHWSRDSLTIDGSTVCCGLTQEETITFPVGECRIEIKWLDESGQTNFANVIRDRIAFRSDRTIMEDPDG